LIALDCATDELEFVLIDPLLDKFLIALSSMVVRVGESEIDGAGVPPIAS
jgi:hypothetical protein